MSDGTKIEWSDASWPVVRGCTKISEGCDNCWAIADAHLHGGRAPSEDELDAASPEAWGRLNGRRKAAAHFKGLTVIQNGRPNWSGEVRADESILDWPLRWKEPRKIFVASSGDLFHERLSCKHRRWVFYVMQEAPQHTYQLLTKRADQMHGFAEWWRRSKLDPPPSNWWFGASVENQQRADERRAYMRGIADMGCMTWVSYEPALGPVDWAGWDFLKWIVIGGESGTRARAFDLAWARNTIEQCEAAGVPCFVKQLGARPFTQGPGEYLSNGERWRLPLKDRKGGDMAEWPEWARVREFPSVAQVDESRVQR